MISDDRLRGVRAWAAARPDMSGSEVIVGAIDELLQYREFMRTEGLALEQRDNAEQSADYPALTLTFTDRSDEARSRMLFAMMDLTQTMRREERVESFIMQKWSVGDSAEKIEVTVVIGPEGCIHDGPRPQAEAK
jgi:hypothetical protein